MVCVTAPPDLDLPGEKGQQICFKSCILSKRAGVFFYFLFWTLDCAFDGLMNCSVTFRNKWKWIWKENIGLIIWHQSSVQKSKPLNLTVEFNKSDAGSEDAGKRG